MKWMDKLNQFNDINEIKQGLQGHHPGIDPDNLKRIIIVGAADEGNRCVDVCLKKGVEVVAVCDDSFEKQGIKIGPCKVIQVAELDRFDKKIPVIIASHRVLKIYLRLKQMDFTHIAPLGFLQMSAPEIFPPHMFYGGILEDLIKNKNHYKDLLDLFCDDYSRRVLDSLIGYRLTMKPETLEPIVEWDLYNPKKLISYKSDEVYIDGGSFDGDSIKLFIERVGGKFKQIFAFEPDPSTYKRLAANFCDDSRVETINKGLYSCSKTLSFKNSATRGSILSQSEGIKIHVTSIDETVKGSPVSFIKMNIEGAERAALEGAAHTIKRYKPKLAVSVYHKPSDLWEIPFLIKSIVSDYKFFLRQHDGGIIESVLYAIPDNSPG